MLENKTVLLGVTGGIAAYKAVEIASRLRKQGAIVKTIMTASAQELVQPRLFQEITGNPVSTSMWAEIPNLQTKHIALAQEADCLLIAPATANIIGKIASGIADDMLSTTVVALPDTTPRYIAPAMNTQMYKNKVVQENLRRLKDLGWHIITPATGRLACGAEGLGRLPEPVDIVNVLQDMEETREADLQGKKVLVTAGGTREAIDPVRYIGNHSSGKMGYALAKAAQLRGAEVVLVTAPTNLPVPHGVEVVAIETAEELRQAVLKYYPEQDIVVMAAAVADYRVKVQSDKKIKKDAEELQLTLVKNTDILRELGEKKTKQILVGFAAETHNLTAYAKEKLQKKNLDFIVANDVTKPGAGFGSDTNIVQIIRPEAVQNIPKMSKEALADLIFDEIAKI